MWGEQVRPDTEQEIEEHRQVMMRLVYTSSEFDHIRRPPQSVTSLAANAAPEPAGRREDVWAAVTDNLPPARLPDPPLVAVTGPAGHEKRRRRGTWAAAIGTAAIATMVAAHNTTAPPDNNPGWRDRWGNWYGPRFGRGTRTSPDPDNVELVDSEEAAYERRRGNRRTAAAATAGFLGGLAFLGVIWGATELFDNDSKNDAVLHPASTLTPAATASPTPGRSTGTTSPTPGSASTTPNSKNSTAATQPNNPSESKKPEKPSEKEEYATGSLKQGETIIEDSKRLFYDKNYHFQYKSSYQLAWVILDENHINVRTGEDRRLPVGYKYKVPKLESEYEYKVTVNIVDHIQYPGDRVSYHAADFLRYTGHRATPAAVADLTDDIAEASGLSPQEVKHVQLGRKIIIPVKAYEHDKK